jgi:hypothetical protein
LLVARLFSKTTVTVAPSGSSHVKVAVPTKDQARSPLAGPHPNAEARRLP